MQTSNGVKFSKLLFLIIILISLLFPLTSLAGGSYYAIINGERVARDFDGLVPCGGPEEHDCQFCHLFVMLDTIIDFVLIYIVFPVATLLLVIGGGILLLSAGDPGKITQGRTILSSTIIGLVIIFSAWLVLGLFFSVIGLSSFGEEVGLDKWFVINCPIVVREPIVREPIVDPVEPPVDVPELPKKTVIFVTTRTFDGNFGGRGGTDARCRENKPANLPSYWNLRAFISVDKEDEIRDMSNVDIDDDGRVGPFNHYQPIYWWHPEDGFTGIQARRIAENWTEMLDGYIETSQFKGTGLPDERPYTQPWTGSNADGSVYTVGAITATCDGWEDSAAGPIGARGHRNLIYYRWLLDVAGGFCSDLQHLRCIVSIEVPEEMPQPPRLPPGRAIVFVTEEKHHGNFSIHDPEGGGDGRIGADAFCEANRPTANFPANCKGLRAFISVGEGDAIQDMHHPWGDGNRFYTLRKIHWWHPVHRAEYLLANNWNEMLDRNIDIRTSQHEGTNDNRRPWTGSSETGEAAADCLRWTVGCGFIDGHWGIEGAPDATNSKWLDRENVLPDWCTSDFPLRCICLIPDQELPF